MRADDSQQQSVPQQSSQQHGAQQHGAGPAPAATAPEAELAREERIAAAERLAEDAFAAYQQQQYQRAIELYQQAWAAAPSADIAFNIARIYDRGLQDRRNAIEHYQRCVAAPKVSPERRLAAERRMAELQAELDRESSADMTPFALESVFSAPAGKLEAPPPPAASSALHDAPARPWTTSQITAVILGGAGVSALGVSLGFALSASGQRAEWERGCDGNACTSQSAVDAARSAGRKADIATAALVTGAGLLGIGAALWFLGPAGSESTPRAELQLVPSGQATDVTCTLTGRF